MAATVRCPICQKPVPFDAPEMPFCSERCRLIDLGNWASEKYKISTPNSPTELDDPEPTDSPQRSGPEGSGR